MNCEPIFFYKYSIVALLIKKENLLTMNVKISEIMLKPLYHIFPVIVIWICIIISVCDYGYQFKNCDFPIICIRAYPG